MTKFAFLAIVLALSAATAARTACYRRCRFFFCDGKTRFLVGKDNDVAFTGAICSKYGKKIETAFSTGEAYWYYSGDIVRISKWEPYGLEQNFSPSFFKSFTIEEGYDYRSGIGHETPETNQLSFLDGECFIVPFTSYQVIKYGETENVNNPGYPLKNCVAFKTFTP